MKLPSVYANKIDKPIKNNCEFCYGDRKQKDLNELLTQFDSNGYTNRLKVHLTLKDKEITTKLLLYRKDHFITIDNTKIYLKDIINYDIIK